MQVRNIKQIKSLKGKRVLVRADFNVPVKNGRVVDGYKIKKSIPTVKYLLDKGAQVVLLSHLGRPKGFDKTLSLKPVAKYLSKLLKQPVGFDKIAGPVTLVENVRFIKGEEDNDPTVAKAFARLGDIFVLDGFAVSHRDAASVSGIAKYLPAYAGLLLTEEITGLARAVEKPKKPFAVVLGGVKMETKIPVLKNLLNKADYILVGGGIASTYFWARGLKVGRSLVDKEFKKEALLYGAHKKVVMPVDVVAGRPDGTGARIVTVEKLNLKKDEAIFDVGPATVRLFARYVKKANTLVWNGALGYFEQKPYQYATYAVARLFAARSRGKAFGIAGGGETVEVLEKLGLEEYVDLVSTGGGAMLEFLSGKKLPGIAAVVNK